MIMKTKKNITNIGIQLALFCLSFNANGQPPPPSPSQGNSVAPIDDAILLLLIAILVYALYLFRNAIFKKDSKTT